MRQTIIYRVEHIHSRCGPYETIGYGLNRSPNRGHTPAPNMDGLEVEMRYRFGFSSITQFKAWFRGAERNVLLRNDYYLFAYMVDAELVKRGGKQIMFIREEAQRLDATPLDHAAKIGHETARAILPAIGEIDYAEQAI